MKITEDNIMELLDRAGLTKELSYKSKKIYQMRTILICKYIHCMNREESCLFMYEEREDYGYISLRTYTNILNKALARLNKIL